MYVCYITTASHAVFATGSHMTTASYAVLTSKHKLGAEASLVYGLGFRL
jgi:hypothetical protein